MSTEIGKRKINRVKTIAENIFNIGKVAALPAVAFLALNDLGATEDIKTAFSKVIETARHGGPFVAGLATGVAQNAFLIAKTLSSLSGKTEPGNYQPTREENDGAFVYQLACVDNRRVDKTGGSLPGSFGPMGAEFSGLAGAMLSQGFLPNTVLGDFLTGYFLGANVLTEIVSHLGLLKEIFKIATNPKNKGRRVKIEMIDHWDGCGAEGFTSPISYWLKFKAHKLTLADLKALPNEIAGYIYVNGILSPLVGILTAGKISLSAVLKHSEMVKTSH